MHGGTHRPTCIFLETDIVQFLQMASEILKNEQNKNLTTQADIRKHDYK